MAALGMVAHGGPVGGAVTPGQRAAAPTVGWVETRAIPMGTSSEPARVAVPRDAALVQRLWIPGRLPGLNEVIEAAKGAGGRGARYARMKRELGEMVWAHAKAAKLRPVKRARLTFHWVEKDRRRDPDNVSSAGRKFILDGLVLAGVLAGDGWAAVAGWSDTFEVGARHGVEVTIEEVTHAP